MFENNIIQGNDAMVIILNYKGIKDRSNSLQINEFRC